MTRMFLVCSVRKIQSENIRTSIYEAPYFCARVSDAGPSVHTIFVFLF